MLIFTFQLFGILIAALMIKNVLKLLSIKNEKQYDFDSYMDNNTILTERFQELYAYLKQNKDVLDSPQYQLLIHQIDEFIVLLKKDFFWEKNPAYSHHKLLHSSYEILDKHNLHTPLSDDILLDYEIEEQISKDVDSNDIKK